MRWSSEVERVVLNALTKTRGFAARHLGLRPNNWHRLEDKPIHLCSGRVQIRAAFAVAEAGSVLLSDSSLQVNAVAYLAQHLIVLLDPADILVNLHHAYRRPEFRDRHYASFHTGPSATADIEGVLIHGAQGVRSLSVLPLARAAGGPTP